MKTITAGAITFVVGNKVGSNMQRYKDWLARDPQRAVADILTGARPTTRAELVEQLVCVWKLSSTVVHVLAQLHEAIAARWVAVILSSGVAVTETADTHLSNYSAPMARLKNIRWPGWDGSAIRGFCVFEPAVRMTQLINFPIEHFGDIQLPTVAFPAPPPTDITPLGGDIAAEIAAAEPEMHRWETYYDDLAVSIRTLTEAFAIR